LQILKIHPPKLGYDSDIQYGFGTIICRIMTFKSDVALRMKKWISQVFSVDLLIEYVGDIKKPALAYNLR
jgi:hypothetical protein